MNVKRETVKSLAALAVRLGVSTRNLSDVSKRPDWQKRVKTKSGYDVEQALAYQTERRQLDMSKVGDAAGNALKALRCKMIAQRLQDGEVRLEMIRRENEAHRKEWEAKDKLWFSREQIVGFAHAVVRSYEQALRGVELQTHDSSVVKVVREIFDRERDKLADEIGGVK
jgi:hypothetical protein